MAYKHEPEYKILWENQRLSLEYSVKAHLEDGWDLHGPTFVHGESWNQVVTKLAVYWFDKETKVELHKGTAKSN